MGVFVAAIWTALLALIPTIVGRVLLSAGIGYATYSGLDIVANAGRVALFSGISGFGGVVVALAGVFQIGTAVNILISAYLARLAFNGLVNGSLTKIGAKS